MIDSKGMPGVEIKDIGEATVAGYLRQLKETVGGCAAETLIFRGHATRDWVLGPELLRVPGRTQKKLGGVQATRMEQRIFDDFSIHLFAFRPDLVVGRGNDRDWVAQWRVMALARHYGLPTRFLDFTTSPLVALFFAVQEKEEDDGVVWIVSTDKRLRVWEVGVGAGLAEGLHIPPLDLSYLMLSASRGRTAGKEWEEIKDLCERVRRRYRAARPSQRGLSQVAFVPEHVDARVAAQGSVFMYELSLYRVRMWERLKTENRIWGIGIPGNEGKNRLRQELSTMGVNSASLFPSLEGTAKHIKWRAQEEWRTHQTDG